MILEYHLREVIKSRIDYLVKGGKHGRSRGKKALAKPHLTGSGIRYLVHGLAIYDRLCRSGLVGDYTCHSSLAILSRPDTSLTSQENVL
jgi:hypothetical protein